MYTSIVLLTLYDTAGCQGQRSGISLVEIIDYLNPQAPRNITYRSCPTRESATMATTVAMGKSLASVCVCLYNCVCERVEGEGGLIWQVTSVSFCE